ncbi:hypothetical protein J7L13_02020, partial [bacterium]|nr:hypothetical protein [bacterium]
MAEKQKISSRSRYLRFFQFSLLSFLLSFSLLAFHQKAYWAGYMEGYRDGEDAGRAEVEMKKGEQSA